jgi:hypothetical protein
MNHIPRRNRQESGYKGLAPMGFGGASVRLMLRGIDWAPIPSETEQRVLCGA